MLNCFFGYSVVWMLILVLYNFKLSAFNHSLDAGLLLFILFTVVSSFFVGYFNKSKFKYANRAVDYGLKPIILIVILFILNFIYAKSIPLFSIITGNSEYREFNSIPILYVVLNGISFYYGINYFNAYLNLDKYKTRNLICFLIINVLYLLVFSRSTILFLITGALILYIMSKRESIAEERKKVKKKKYALIIISTFLILYLFGALGNVRSGLKYNDNSYIQRIGLYTNYPEFLPKQFMWSYSYLTSPLANLNNNVLNHKDIDFNIRGVMSELLNRTFSKQLFPDLKYGEEAVLDVGIEKEYFSASTGYFLMYTYGGFVGLFIQYILLFIISYIQIRMLKNKHNEGKENCTFIILLLANVLMFFYNSLNTATISWWLIINFVALLKKPKIKWRS